MDYKKSSRILLSFFFLSQSTSFTASLVIPLFTEASGLSAAMTGVILASIMISAAMLQPVLGRLLDQGRFWTSQVLILFGYTLGVYAFWKSQAPTGLLIAGVFAVTIAMNSLRTLTMSSLLGPLPEHERSDAIALRYLISNGAMAVAALLALWGLESYRSEFFLIDWFTTMLLTVVCAWLARRSFAKRSEQSAAPLPILRLLRDVGRKNFRKILGLMLMGISLTSHMTYIPMLYQKLKLAPTEGQALMLLVNTTLVVLALPLVRRMKYQGQQRGLYAMGFMAVGLLGLPWVDSKPLLIATTVIWTIGEIFFVPWEIEAFYRCFDSDQIGFASGSINLLFTMNMTLAPLYSAALIVSPPLLASAIYGLTPVLGFALVIRAERLERLGTSG